MKSDHFVWLIWASSFLIPWFLLFWLLPTYRSLLWKVSICTAPFGLSEPFFVPEYWNPPSLFNLAQRTGFDIESLIFSFAIGGIGATAYNLFTRIELHLLSKKDFNSQVHKLHTIAILSPFVVFFVVKLLPWNPIYAGITSMFFGSLASVLCRRDLLKKTIVGALIFFALYSVFLVGLELLSPGYVSRYWNWKAISGIRIFQFPIEEFLFAISFGMYWSSVYEHLLWSGVRIGKPHRE